MGGQAVAEVISGKVNPSGKLPVTMPRSVGQVPTVYNHKQSQYSRLFATNETGPLWPFGFGLSYSRFRYSGLEFISVEHPEVTSAIAAITVSITNEGPFDGAEVVQLYIRDEYASVTRPVKELKAFKRIFLKNGESTDVTFEITPEMLQCFGADNRWTLEPGDFTIMVGSSSADEDLQQLSLTVDAK